MRAHRLGRAVLPSWRRAAHACAAMLFVGVCFVRFGAPVSAQLPVPEGPSPATEDASLGIPVTSELVRDACGACHEADAEGRMTRISYRRTTPEGWQQTIQRMVALNGLVLTPEEGREILAYLATQHGLAPEEVEPARFEVERRLVDYTYDADETTGDICNRCHSVGRVLLQRRTKNDWALLLAMHRGYYPYVDFQAFRRTGPAETEPGPDGRPPDNRHPMDKALEHLAKAFPLHTSEWASWSATMRVPEIEGTWSLDGYQTGKGPVYGTLTITKGTREGEFESRAQYSYAHTGEKVARTGRAVIYTGFQWRGRSSQTGGDPQEMREVLMVSRDWSQLTGRWFMGHYDETGIDVRLTRATGPVLTGVWPQRLRRDATGQELRVFGVELPARPAAEVFNFGPGIRVADVTSAGAGELRLRVDVTADARPGRRDVFLGGANGRATVAVYDRIDAIEVRPTWAMARLGGGGSAFQKGYQQFEAVALSHGPDGQAGTADDFELGLVDARWSLEEFAATYDDDDIEFVGTIDAETGFFTPNVDGPNPKRRGNTNNYGDVWVVAQYEPAGAPEGGRPLRARAHLLVTVPLYMRFDRFEVGR